MLFRSVYITDVQLETGSLATPYEARLIGAELALCQRYYETGVGFGVASSTTRIVSAINYKVSKRTNATPAFYYGGDNLQQNYVWDPGIAAPAVSAVPGTQSETSGYQGFGFYFDLSAGNGTVGHGYGYFFRVNAEL